MADSESNISSRGRRSRRGAVAALAAAAALCLPLSAAPTRGASSRESTQRDPSRVIALRAVRFLEPSDRGLLLEPGAVAVDHRGNIVVADTGNHRIVVLSSDGGFLDEFGGYGWEEGLLDTPSDLSVYQGFYTYVLDEGNRRVVRYDVEGDYVDTVIPGDAAGTPVALAVGPSGGIFLVDSDSQSVLSYSQFDEILEPVGRFGTGIGGLTEPADVAVGPLREIAVADLGRGTVELFDEFGAVLLSLCPADSMLPEDVAVDSAGNIFVADGRRNRILVFPRGENAHSATLGGDASGFRPTALALGNSGELVALDRRTGRIQMIEIIYGGKLSRRP